MTCYIPVRVEQEVEGVPLEGYDPFFFPPEGDYLPFYFTDETFTKVLSALINGAMLTYGNEGMQVIWYFLKNVEFPMPLCDLIADCIATSPAVAEALAELIENNETVQDALTDFIINNEDINNNITNIVEGLTSEQLAGAVTNSCDNNVLAGQVITIVERMHTYNKDALQIIEVATNDEERIGAVLEGIPVLGELPFGDILELVQKLLEDFTENYDAAVTEAWKTSVEEDLYCLAKDKANCELSYADLFGYFQQRVGSGLTVESLLQDVLGFVLTGDFNTDDLVASGMFALQLAFVRVGRQFFGLDLPKFTSLVRDAGTSTEWEEWDECVTGDCMSMTEWEVIPGGWGEKSGGTIAAQLYVGDNKYYLKIYLASGSIDGVDYITAAKFSFSRPVTNMRLSTTSGAALASYTGPAVNQITFDASNEIVEGIFPIPVMATGGFNMQLSVNSDVGLDTALTVTQFCWETS